MRTETDKFEFDGDVIYAEPGSFDYEICLNIDKARDDREHYAYITKDQARQFAMQLLEMCEPEAAEQPEFLFIKESDCE